MTSDKGVLEGKKWWAVYVTPKLIRSIAGILLMVCLAAMAMMGADMMSKASVELDAAIAEGLVPKCVKDFIGGISLMLISAVMFIWNMVRR